MFNYKSWSGNSAGPLKIFHSNIYLNYYLISSQQLSKAGLVDLETHKNRFHLTPQDFVHIFLMNLSFTILCPNFCSFVDLHNAFNRWHIELGSLKFILISSVYSFIYWMLYWNICLKDSKSIPLAMPKYFLHLALLKSRGNIQVSHVQILAIDLIPTVI